MANFPLSVFPDDDRPPVLPGMIRLCRTGIVLCIFGPVFDDKSFLPREFECKGIILVLKPNAQVAALVADNQAIFNVIICVRQVALKEEFHFVSVGTITHPVFQWENYSRPITFWWKLTPKQV
jgi:hypothetical protein